MTNFERTAGDETTIGGHAAANGRGAHDGAATPVADPRGSTNSAPPDSTLGGGTNGAGEARPRVDMARLVRGMHERCARRVAAALTEACRTPIEVRVSEVEFVEYRQFVLDVESPTCLAVLRVEALDVPVALDLTSSVLFALLAALLGGKPRDEDPPQRPLTEIEQRLAARVVRAWQQELRSAWRPVAPLEPTFDRWEYHPHRAALAPLREPLMVVRFQTRVGEVDGIVTLAVPRRAIDELSARGGRADTASPIDGIDTAALEPTAAASSATTLELRLDEVPVALADLRTLRVGDVIATSHPVERPLVVFVNDRPQFAGRPGIVHGRRAVRLEQEISGEHAPCES